MNDKRHTVMALTTAGINILELCTQRINNVFEQTIQMDNALAAQLNELLEQIRKNES